MWMESRSTLPAKSRSRNGNDKKSVKGPGDNRVSLWDVVRQKKLSGFASPMQKNLQAYLQKHPNCIVYDKTAIYRRDDNSQIDSDEDEVTSQYSINGSSMSRSIASNNPNNNNSSRYTVLKGKKVPIDPVLSSSCPPLEGAFGPIVSNTPIRSPTPIGGGQISSPSSGSGSSNTNATSSNNNPLGTPSTSSSTPGLPPLPSMASPNHQTLSSDNAFNNRSVPLMINTHPSPRSKIGTPIYSPASRMALDFENMHVVSPQHTPMHMPYGSVPNDNNDRFSHSARGSRAPSFVARNVPLSSSLVSSSSSSISYPLPRAISADPHLSTMRAEPAHVIHSLPTESVAAIIPSSVPPTIIRSASVDSSALPASNTEPSPRNPSNSANTKYQQSHASHRSISTPNPVMASIPASNRHSHTRSEPGVPVSSPMSIVSNSTTRRLRAASVMRAHPYGTPKSSTHSSLGTSYTAERLPDDSLIYESEDQDQVPLLTSNPIHNYKYSASTTVGHSFPSDVSSISNVSTTDQEVDSYFDMYDSNQPFGDDSLSSSVPLPPFSYSMPSDNLTGKDPLNTLYPSNDQSYNGWQSMTTDSSALYESYSTNPEISSTLPFPDILGEETYSSTLTSTSDAFTSSYYPPYSHQSFMDDIIPIDRSFE